MEPVDFWYSDTRSAENHFTNQFQSNSQFHTRGSHPGATWPNREHVAMSKDVFDGDNWGWGATDIQVGGGQGCC